jgi:hypothetical protein
MPRPPSDRVEEGFLLWSTRAERNDTRTAELLGVPQSTVSYWHRTYGWDERYFRLVQPDGDLLAGVARSEIRSVLPLVVMRLRSIVAGRKPVFNAQGEQIGETWQASDRDAVQAAKLLAQYGFEGGAGMDSTIIDVHPVALPESTEEPLERIEPQGELSVAELRQRASAMIEATVQAVNTRPSQSRKRV